MGAKIKKLTVAVPFPVYPSHNGGTKRVFELYSRLALWFDIELVTFGYLGQRPCKMEIAPGLWENRVPRSVQHQQAERELESKLGLSVPDIALTRLYHLTPEYLRALKQSTENSDVVIVCHPYLFPVVREVTDLPVWFEAQDVEIELKQKMLPESPLGLELLEETRKVEMECAQYSEIIMLCGREDKVSFNKLYSIEFEKMVLVPNGVDFSKVSFIPPTDRIRIKTNNSKNNDYKAIFLGSNHGPNVEAARELINIAPQIPDVKIMIVGSVGQSLLNLTVPPNVLITGIIDDQTKNELINTSDLALNPVTYGSGTNLKMLEYFAAGLPVISTPTGVRGLDLEDGKQVVISDIKDFAKAIKYCQNEDLSFTMNRVFNVKQYVEENFAWSVIAERLIDYLGNRTKVKYTPRKLEPLKTPPMKSANLKALAGDRPLMIWGAGSAGMSVLNFMKKKGIDAFGFIDKSSAKWGTEVSGLPVYPPTFLIGKQQTKKQPFVIIASTYADEIKKELDSWGLRHEKDYLQQDITVNYLFLW